MSNLLPENHCMGKKQRTILGAFKKMSEKQTSVHTGSNITELVPASQLGTSCDSAKAGNEEVTKPHETTKTECVNFPDTKTDEQECTDDDLIYKYDKLKTVIVSNGGDLMEIKENTSFTQGVDVDEAKEASEHSNHTNYSSDATEHTHNSNEYVSADETVKAHCSTESAASVNSRRTRSGVVPSPHAKQTKKRRNSKKDNSYTCPVCTHDILCSDLNEFNRHVDDCLNQSSASDEPSLSSAKSEQTSDKCKMEAMEPGQLVTSFRINDADAHSDCDISAYDIETAGNCGEIVKDDNSVRENGYNADEDSVTCDTVVRDGNQALKDSILESDCSTNCENKLIVLDRNAEMGKVITSDGIATCSEKVYTAPDQLNCESKDKSDNKLLTDTELDKENIPNDTEENNESVLSDCDRLIGGDISMQLDERDDIGCSGKHDCDSDSSKMDGAASRKAIDNALVNVNDTDYNTVRDTYPDNSVDSIIHHQHEVETDVYTKHETHRDFDSKYTTSGNIDPECKVYLHKEAEHKIDSDQEHKTINNNDPEQTECNADTDPSDSLLVCPICNIEQRCGSLADFNDHVDSCLSKGAIKEILEEQRKKDHKPQKR